MTPPKGSRAASSGKRKAAGSGTGSGKQSTRERTNGGITNHDVVPVPTNSITVEADGLFVPLSDDQMERLKRLAGRKGEGVDVVARDILAQFLKLVE